MERKVIPFELSKADGDGRVIEGHAAVFGNVDLGGDVVHPGAFKKTLAERGNKVKFLWQHDPSEPIGKVLFLQEDDKGLFIRARVSETRRGNDALALMKDGAVGELSFGYDAVKGGTDYSKSDSGETVRNLREIRLYEVSPVTFAMNEEASILGVKAVDVTENSVRVRVKDPGDFQEGTFRTITIGKESDGIQAVIGKLSGETTTTIQTYIFDKDKWSKEEAVAWVESHKKSVNLSEEVRKVEQSFMSQYNPPQGPWIYWVRTVYDDSIVISKQGANGEEYYSVPYIIADDVVTFAAMPEWKPGIYEFTAKSFKATWDIAYINDLPDSAFLYIEPGGEKDDEGKTKPRSMRHFPYRDSGGAVDLPHLRNAIARIPQSNAPGLDDAKKESLQERARSLLEKENEKGDNEEVQSKEGRVLAGRNVERITRAVTSLVEALQDAGVDFEMPKPAKPAPMPEEHIATDGKAGPEGDKPTQPTSLTEVERKLRMLEIEQLQIENILAR
jgi:hypothetical protein